MLITKCGRSSLQIGSDDWGEWSKLQKTYSEYERGNLTAKQAARDIQRNAIALAGPEAEGGVRAGMTHAEAGKMGGRGKKASAAGTGLTRGSNQARTIVARLKKDRPDVAERLAAGEFRSARAAAIEAVYHLGPKLDRSSVREAECLMAP